MNTSKNPRRSIALGPPYDDGTYWTPDGVKHSLGEPSEEERRRSAALALVADIQKRLGIMAGPGVVGLPKEKEWRAIFGEMIDDLQMVLDVLSPSGD